MMMICKNDEDDDYIGKIEIKYFITKNWNNRLLINEAIQDAFRSIQ